MHTTAPVKETDENIAENNVAEDRPAKRCRVAGGPEAAAACQARGYAPGPRHRSEIGNVGPKSWSPDLIRPHEKLGPQLIVAASYVDLRLPIRPN
jgi:hypothetical protein